MGHWLAHLYQAKASRNPTRLETTLRIVRDRLAADATLMAAAQEERARLAAFNEHCGGQLRQRCFVSATHLDTLSSLLTPP